MSPVLVFSVIVVYFSALIFISYLTSKKSNTETFFTGNNQSPWYLVAFGMIGTSISGVTFISIPGEVGNSGFTYFQMVIGYLLGYYVIANVLMPIYYRLKLVSIYTYLEQRFGNYSYKTGAIFFIISRVIGAGIRLFLAATVLQLAFFDKVGIPFEITVLVTIMLIWVYTYKAGVKTIVWTDSFQSIFLITALIVSIYLVGKEMNTTFFGILEKVSDCEYTRIFDWNWHSDRFFFKQFFSGAFIAIVMTGLDQDLMQKNLTCRNLNEAKKNMFWFTITLIPVNLLFLSLGAILYTFYTSTGLSFTGTDVFHYSVEAAKYLNTDKLYPELAINHFGALAGITFLLGIIAATFASSDSALTALTTSFTVDILGVDVRKDSKVTKKKKLLVHLGFSFVLFLVILVFKWINDKSVINAVFTIAGYTYGPLLGLYSFGLFTKRKVKDKIIPFIAILSPCISFLISSFSHQLLFGYKFGFEILLLNGLLMYIGMLLVSYKNPNPSGKVI
jgi:Na+/proline symporter